MLETCMNGGWALCLDGRELVRHTQDAPFAVAVRQEKDYKSSRGTVKVTVRERSVFRSRILSKAAAASHSAPRGIRCAWNIRRFPAARSFAFPARRGWGYEFSLPAVRG